jgi:catecholate siderophore receptor
MRLSRLSISLASVLATGLLAPAGHAQSGPFPSPDGATEEADRNVVYVYGTRSSYLDDASSSATRTATPLEDIPQSVFIITRDAIDDQAITSLGELARYVPGMTMGQGEGHRDAPVFRGNISTSDLFVDGVRDDLQYLRDLYNVERVDVLLGPSALVYGRGSGGGAINRVSKTAADPVLAVGASIGSFGQARLGADLGAVFSDSIAGRLNAVVEDSESYRDDVELKRLGLAPTLRVDASESTRIDVFGEYFSDERTVDRGVPSESGRPWRGPAETYFGNPDLSDSEIEVATLRGVVSHEFAPGLSFRGVLSYGDYSKFYRNVYPGGPADSVADTVTISSYDSATDRQNLLAQADLVWETALAGMNHTLLFGVEAGRQKSENRRVNTASGVFSLSDRGRNFTPDFSVAPALDNVNDLDLLAVLVQDQVAFSSSLKAVLGLRWDSFDLVFDDRRPGASDFARKDEFVSPRAGLIWEPVSGLSLYGGWSRAFLPQSGEQFNSLNASRAALRPEEFENTELGLRWQPSGNLLVSATVFRLDRTNTTAAGATPGTLLLTGSQRSEGIEFGIQGEVRDGWNVIGALAVQEAEITSTTTAAPAGRKAPLVPEFSASLWNRVNLSSNFDIAFGVVHQGEQYASITNAVVLPAYTRLDAALFYAISDTVDLQLNVENLTGEEYWYTAHNDNNITPGSPVSVRLGLEARF